MLVDYTGAFGQFMCLILVLHLPGTFSASYRNSSEVQFFGYHQNYGPKRKKMIS